MFFKTHGEALEALGTRIKKFKELVLEKDPAATVNPTMVTPSSFDLEVINKDGGRDNYSFDINFTTAGFHITCSRVVA